LHIHRVWKEFENPARSDGLLLRHWERKSEAPNELSYQFSKFNVQVDVPQYTDGEYEMLKNDDWSREETDYLFSMCREYDLRFPIIWDRYEWPGKKRSLEDLKARYYTSCRSLMELRTPMGQMSPETLNAYNHLNFDKEREVMRRSMAERQFNKTQEQFAEEEMLLTELKRIVGNQEKMFEERRDIHQRLSFPTTTGSIQPYTGSQGLAHLRDMMLSSSDKNKKRKSVALGQGSVGDGALQTPTTANSTDKAGTGGSSKERDGKEVKRQLRKLTKEEEQQYGVSYHEKLSSGVKLRSGMVSSTVKGATATKVATALTQLGIAPRLTMPTASAVQRYEQLQNAVGVMLDSKKLLDKMEQEARVLKAQLDLKEG
jgi:DNA methyltransferase 1-associated protein 1